MKGIFRMIIAGVAISQLQANTTWADSAHARFSREANRQRRASLQPSFVFAAGARGSNKKYTQKQDARADYQNLGVHAHAQVFPGDTILIGLAGGIDAFTPKLGSAPKSLFFDIDGYLGKSLVGDLFMSVSLNLDLGYSVSGMITNEKDFGYGAATSPFTRLRMRVPFAEQTYAEIAGRFGIFEPSLEKLGRERDIALGVELVGPFFLDRVWGVGIQSRSLRFQDAGNGHDLSQLTATLSAYF